MYRSTILMLYPQPRMNDFARSARIPDTFKAKIFCSNKSLNSSSSHLTLRLDDDPLGVASQGCSQLCLVSIM